MKMGEEGVKWSLSKIRKLMKTSMENVILIYEKVP